MLQRHQFPKTRQQKDAAVSVRHPIYDTVYCPVMYTDKVFSFTLKILRKHVLADAFFIVLFFKRGTRQENNRRNDYSDSIKKCWKTGGELL